MWISKKKYREAIDKRDNLIELKSLHLLEREEALYQVCKCLYKNGLKIDGLEIKIIPKDKEEEDMIIRIIMRIFVGKAKNKLNTDSQIMELLR